MSVSPFYILLGVAAGLFLVAAYLNFTNHAHALGWACIGLAVFAVAGWWTAAVRRLP